MKQKHIVIKIEKDFMEYLKVKKEIIHITQLLIIIGELVLKIEQIIYIIIMLK